MIKMPQIFADNENARYKRNELEYIFSFKNKKNRFDDVIYIYFFHHSVHNHGTEESQGNKCECVILYLNKH